MKENNNQSRHITIDGKEYFVTSHFNDSAEDDIVNLIYNKFKQKGNKNKLGLMRNPLYKKMKK